MRRILVGILGLGACLLTAAPARAGVYGSFDWGFPSPTDPQMNENWIKNLRSLPALTPEQIARMNPHDIVMSLITPYPLLLAQEQDGRLTNLDRIDLGACYIRRAKWAEAIRVLEGGDRTHFLILANLASAYQGIGRLDRAMDYQKEALKAWPSTWAWWNEGQRRWFRRVEEYNLTLLRVRAIEEARNRGRASAIKTVDNLFNGVRFVGPSGEYESGRLADSMFNRLPPDCIQIVYQLLFWNPGDDRLHWLLGELINGYAGDSAFALGIFDELVGKRGFNTDELKQHRRDLLKSQIQLRPKNPDKPGEPDEKIVFWLSLACLSDVQATPCGVAGALHQGGVATATVAKLEGRISGPGQRDVSLPSPSRPRPPFSWKHVAVGFVAGAAFAALAALQLRQWRRRQAANSAALLVEDEKPAPTEPVGAADAPSEQVQPDASRPGVPGPG